MRRARRVLGIAIVFFLSLGAGIGHLLPSSVGPPAASAASVQAGAKISEESAAAALMQMGVPLGRDPSGRVRWMEAAGVALDDEALRLLPSLPLLEWLEIGGGKITAAGLGMLKDCQALRRLYVHDINLAENDLGWIAGLKLEALSLQRTGVSGAALRQLKAMDTLAVLNLSENAIVDEDLEPVARLVNLEVLALQNTRVTGAGLARLKNMTRLNVLNIINCRIVDADLAHFMSMPNLRIVQAAGCNLSDQAVKDLTDKLSMLAIFR
jgi:hypothetical protein